MTNLNKLSNSSDSAMKKKLCMIPGPIEVHEDVSTAMATGATSHLDPGFIQVYGEALELLRDVVMTKAGQPFIIAGSGTLGWDMTASNLLEEGDQVLVYNTGYFGDKFGACLEVYGARVTHLRCGPGSVPSLDSLEQALQSKDFKMVTITQVDTSTAVLSDVRAIASMVRKYSPSTLVVVDGVCSIGSEEFRMDEWDIDVVLTASQKALGASPGLCVAVVSNRAMSVFHGRTTPVRSYYASWMNWLPIMKAYESRTGKYFATPAVQLIMGLHKSLKQIVSQGMEARFKKHWQVSNYFKETIRSWGLKQLPESDAVAARGMTAIYYPETINNATTEFLPKVMKKVAVAGGLHSALGSKYFRVGHMGLSAIEDERRHIQKTLDAIQSALKECGYYACEQSAFLPIPMSQCL